MAMVVVMEAMVTVMWRWRQWQWQVVRSIMEGDEVVVVVTMVELAATEGGSSVDGGGGSWNPMDYKIRIPCSSHSSLNMQRYCHHC